MSKVFVKLSGLFAIIFSSINILVFIMINYIVPYVYLIDDVGAYIVLFVITIMSLIYLLTGLTLFHYCKLSDKELVEKKKTILVIAFILFVLNPLASLFAFISYFTINDINMNRERVVAIDYIDEIRKLKKLKDDGYITEKEFEMKKKQILNI